MKIYIEKSKLTMRVVSLVFLLVLGVALMFFSFAFILREDLVAAVVIILASSFLVLAMAFVLKVNLAHKEINTPVLEIDKKGLLDRRIMKLPVPWNRLEWFYSTFKSNPSIAINIIEHEENYLKEQNILDKFARRIAKSLGFPQLHIDLMALDVSADRIREEFEKFKTSIVDRDNCQD